MKSFEPGQPFVVVNAAIWTMLTIATIFLALRIYCRLVRSRQLWWDDYILVASWGLMLASSAVLAEALRLGYLDTDMGSPRLFLLSRVSHTCHLVSLALCKTSFAVTLLRFSTKMQKYIIWFIIGSIAVIFTIHVFLLWKAMCGVPPSHVLPGDCWDPQHPIIMNITTSMYSAVTDFVLALLPWKVIMGLQMKKAERISVALAMSVGAIAGITGVMKSVQSIMTLNPMHPDFTYNLILFWIFSLAEPNSTIIAASIPVLRVLVRDARTTYGGYNGSSGGPAAYIKSQNSRFHVQNDGERTVTEPSSRGNMDASSDRSILGHSPERPTGISRTTEVTVEYENGRSISPGIGHEPGAFEMQPRSSRQIYSDKGAMDWRSSTRRS